MKTFLIFCTLFTLGCADLFGNVVKVCARTDWPDAFCGTGFFIDDDTVVTAGHVLDMSSNGEIMVLEGVAREYSEDFDYDMTLDTGCVALSEKYSNDPLRLCEIHEDLTEVVIFGIVDDEQKEYLATIHHHTEIRVYLDTDIVVGVSGGPIIDVERDCVIGAVSGYEADSGLVIGPTAHSIRQLLER